ncbi:hypothetical protein ACHAPA_004019 [Fusarium lateritium]
MQLLSFSFVLLAALGAQAMPAKQGTAGILALGQCTAFEGQCLVNGRREICNIGKCSGVNTNCDNDGGVVSCS